MTPVYQSHGFVVSLLSFVAFAGCNPPATTDTGNADPPAVATTDTYNQVCPIMGGEVTAEGGTVEWDGKTIGFCCDGCDEKWEALSEDEKAEKLAAAQADAEGEHDQP